MLALKQEEAFTKANLTIKAIKKLNSLFRNKWWICGFDWFRFYREVLCKNALTSKTGSKPAANISNQEPTYTYVLIWLLLIWCFSAPSKLREKIIIIFNIIQLN